MRNTKLPKTVEIDILYTVPLPFTALEKFVYENENRGIGSLARETNRTERGLSRSYDSARTKVRALKYLIERAEKFNKPEALRVLRAVVLNP